MVRGSIPRPRQEVGGGPIESRQFAELCAEVAAEKKARKIAVLEVGELLTIVEYFVICTGVNPRQVKSIAEAIDRKAKEVGVPKLFIDGTDLGKWACLDFDDVVVHVFQPELREFYGLEHLWADAPRLKLPGITDGKSSTEGEGSSEGGPTGSASGTDRIEAS